MRKIIITIFAISFIACHNKPKYLVKIEANQQAITEEITPDEQIEGIIKPFREEVENEMSTVISYTKKDLTRTDGDLESSLGNILADLCFERANPVFKSMTNNDIDFAMFNYGGIRAGISKGGITNLNAFQLMPFENRFVVVELTPKKIIELANYLTANNKAHPLSKQINLTIKNDDFDLLINGLKIDKTRNYFVLTSDYLQGGGDKMIFFKDPVSLHKLDYKVRDAIIDYFKEIDTVRVKLDGRFKKLDK